MTLFWLGLIFASLATYASQHLGDQHPVSKVAGWSPWKRLTHILPQPTHVVYGLPVGGFLGFGGILLAAAGAWAFEKYLTPQDNVAGFEWEDVRDVAAGALLGAVVSALVS